MPEIKKYLSKNGLEDYNELLPHSATQMQEYVADWLDAHPEATTTVEDNSITTAKLRDGCVTTPKLADESVTPNKISQDLYQLITGNVLRGNASGDVVSVNDAFATFPLGVAVDGKSTQNGTPTPENPVPIDSVDELTLAFAGKNLFDYPTEPWTNTTGGIVNSNTFSGGYRPIPDGVTTITASMYIDNSAATGPACLNTWARRSDGTVVAIGASAEVAAGSRAHVSKTYDVSGYTDFGIGARLYPNATVSQLMSELGSTATAYEPYAGHTVPIDLQDHVLRSLPDGTKDTLALTYLRPSTREGWAWYSRELTQAIDIVTFDGTQNWFLSASGTYTRFGSSSVLLSACTPFADKLAYYQLADLLTHPYGINAQSNNRVYVSLDETVTTEAQAKAWFASNNVTMQYKLPTPVTHDLGEVELPVLPAPNCTVWADPTTGVMLSYERDLTIAINAIEQAIADQ